jgi:hypothetical protein
VPRAGASGLAVPVGCGRDGRGPVGGDGSGPDGCRDGGAAGRDDGAVGKDPVGGAGQVGGAVGWGPDGCPGQSPCLGGAASQTGTRAREGRPGSPGYRLCGLAIALLLINKDGNEPVGTHVQGVEPPDPYDSLNAPRPRTVRGLAVT